MRACSRTHSIQVVEKQIEDVLCSGYPRCTTALEEINWETLIKIQRKAVAEISANLPGCNVYLALAELRGQSMQFSSSSFSIVHRMANTAVAGDDKAACNAPSRKIVNKRMKSSQTALFQCLEEQKIKLVHCSRSLSFAAKELTLDQARVALPFYGSNEVPFTPNLVPLLVIPLLDRTGLLIVDSLNSKVAMEELGINVKRPSSASDSESLYQVVDTTVIEEGLLDFLVKMTEIFSQSLIEIRRRGKTKRQTVREEAMKRVTETCRSFLDSLARENDHEYLTRNSFTYFGVLEAHPTAVNAFLSAVLAIICETFPGSDAYFGWISSDGGALEFSCASTNSRMLHKRLFRGKHATD